MKLRWTRSARRDREAIYAYVQADNAEAALTLDERILQRVNQLVEFPLIGREGRLAGMRELSIPGSSYLLAYTVTGDTIWIAGVIHTARAWPDQTE